MKNICLLMSMFLFAFVMKAEKVESKLDSVTVYLTGAELNHSVSCNLKKGKNTFAITGISPKINENSVVVEISSGAATIFSVSTHTNYLKIESQAERINRLKDSIEFLERKLRLVNGKIEILENEKELLFKNQSVGGINNNLSAVEIEKGADFFRKRSEEILLKLIELNERSQNLDLRSKKFKNQLMANRPNQSNAEKQIVIVLTAENPGKVKLNFRYLVNNAGWAPKYDIRSKGDTSMVDLGFFAHVYNATGLDWNKLNMKLSTMEPGKSALRPQLTAWKINTNRYSHKPAYNRKNYSYGEGVVADTIYKSRMRNGDGIAMTSISVGELNTEYPIPVLYTIPSNSKPYLVEVAKYKLPSMLEYYTVPRIDKDAFLVAKVTKWNELNLVSGKASVFLRGSYIGESFLNTNVINDTLTLSLGRDNRIIVKRILLKEKTKNVVIGSSVKDISSYEIAVRNNHQNAIKIQVQDLVPVSTDSKITVEINEKSEGSLEENTGIITWNLDLKPGETKVMKIEYTVKSPSGTSYSRKNYNGRLRQLNAPSF